MILPIDAPSETISSLSRLNRSLALSCPKTTVVAANRGTIPNTHARIETARLWRLLCRPNRRARIVRPKNRAIILPRPRTPDGARLTHPDAMSVTHSVQRESRDRAVRCGRCLDGKIGAVENLATGWTQHESSIVPAHHEIATIGRDSDSAHTTRRRMRANGDVARRSRRAVRNRRVRGEILGERRGQRRPLDGARP